MALAHRTMINLIGVKEKIKTVTLLALELSPVYFEVIQGLRSVAEQKADVAAGKSKTMQSKHLTGDAVDVAALAGRKYLQDAASYCQVAHAFRAAAIELKIPLIWGAVWDKTLTGLSDDLNADIIAYRARQTALGNHRPLIDLDHFELDSRIYPAGNQ